MPVKVVAAKKEPVKQQVKKEPVKEAPKQVTKVPAGASQTGGEPADPASAGWLVAGLAGAGAAGAGGVFLVRRRSASRG